MSLSLTYSLRNIKMNYDRALFGMKLGDCKALARALEHSETLVRLQVWQGLVLGGGLLLNCKVVTLMEATLQRTAIGQRSRLVSDWWHSAVNCTLHAACCGENIEAKQQPHTACACSRRRSCCGM